MCGIRCTFYERCLDIEEISIEEIKMRGYVKKLECLGVMRSKMS